MTPANAPILSCDESRDFEAGFFGGDEAKQWEAIRRAGKAVAAAVLNDFQEIGPFPSDARILVLAGKGHNGGDALIAARAILDRHPEARAEVVFPFGERALRPLALRAWRELGMPLLPERTTFGCSPFGCSPSERSPLRKERNSDSAAHSSGRRVANRRVADLAGSYDLCLDGLFGFQFHPPLPSLAAAALRRVNGLSVRLRAAVDLPSGLSEPDAFRADFTYATGILKSPLLHCLNAGRVRYLDLGFFRKSGSRKAESGNSEGASDRVLLAEVLEPLAALRSSASDKRSYGHLCIVAGSLGYPGAALMSVLAALRSGAGLVTAFVPESLVPAYAARAPEAMWVGWPVNPRGGLASKGLRRLRARLDQADAMVIGPGLGRDPDTLRLVAALVKAASVPVLLDADALQPEIIRAAKTPLLLTPHAGEFKRIAGNADLTSFCAKTGATVVLKGPVTRISAPAEPRRAKEKARVYHSFFGGPVLARGGSGDILSGLTGGLLAQTPEDRLLAGCLGAVWHGRAADLLARAHGQTAVSVTQLLDFLPGALRPLAIIPDGP